MLINSHAMGGFDDSAALASWSHPFWSVPTELPSDVFLIA